MCIRDRYELDYAKHYERVKEKELPADTVKLIYEHGEREIPAGQFFKDVYKRQVINLAALGKPFPMFVHCPHSEQDMGAVSYTHLWRPLPAAFHQPASCAPVQPVLSTRPVPSASCPA